MSRAGAGKVGAPPSAKDAGKGGIRTPRVSQIIVQPVLLNEHDAPFTAEPITFIGNQDGTAAEHLAAWLDMLPVHLEVAAAQIAAKPGDNGASG